MKRYYVDSHLEIRLVFPTPHGASKTDLEPFAEQLLAGAPGWSFVLPSAPHSVGLSGKTWYPSVTSDSQEGLKLEMQKVFAEARDVALDIARDLVSDGVPPEQIFVGGFSQGANVALDVVMSDPEGAKLGGLVSLSGGASTLDLAPLGSRPTMRAFVSHGRTDRVLSVGVSRRLAEVLEEGGHEVEFVEFDGGHQIPDEVTESLVAFLNAE